MEINGKKDMFLLEEKMLDREPLVYLFFPN